MMNGSNKEHVLFFRRSLIFSDFPVLLSIFVSGFFWYRNSYRIIYMFILHITKNIA